MFGQFDSQHMFDLAWLFAHTNTQWTPKWCPLDHLHACFWIQTELPKVEQLFRVLVTDTQDKSSLSLDQLRQRNSLTQRDHSILTGNGVAMRINCGIAKQRIELILKFFGDDMLQFIGLVMHFIPAVAQFTRQVKLEQAMMPDNLHCLAFT